jgi:hypothetical protein
MKCCAWRSDGKEGGLCFQAFCFAGSASIFDVFLDVVTQMATLAKMGKILCSDIHLVVFVCLRCKGLSKVCRGENDDASSDGMRLFVCCLTPLTAVSRSTADAANDALPIAWIS